MRSTRAWQRPVSMVFSTQGKLAYMLLVFMFLWFFFRLAAGPRAVEIEWTVDAPAAEGRQTISPAACIDTSRFVQHKLRDIRV